VQVSAGCGHSGFITENGHAFTFGDDRYNQLGAAKLFNYDIKLFTELILLQVIIVLMDRRVPFLQESFESYQLGDAFRSLVEAATVFSSLIW
jgi:alpha-tubulin suppressor-like RCC1 family protein